MRIKERASPRDCGARNRFTDRDVRNTIFSGCGIARRVRPQAFEVLHLMQEPVGVADDENFGHILTHQLHVRRRTRRTVKKRWELEAEFHRLVDNRTSSPFILRHHWQLQRPLAVQIEVADVQRQRRLHPLVDALRKQPDELVHVGLERRLATLGEHRNQRRV